MWYVNENLCGCMRHQKKWESRSAGSGALATSQQIMTNYEMQEWTQVRMENWQDLGFRPTVLNPWCEESPMKHRATAVWYNSPWPWGFPKRERIPEMANHCHHSGWTQTKWRGPDCQGTARTGWSVKPGSQPGIIAPEWGRRAYSQVAAVVNQESNSSNTSEAGPTSSWKNQQSGRGQDEDEVSYSHWWLGMSTVTKQDWGQARKSFCSSGS